MRRPSRAWLVTALAFLAVGFFLGDVFGGYAAGVLSFVQFIIGIVGLGGVLTALEILQRRLSKPTLTYGKLYKSAEGTHYLRVKKSGGSDRARDSEGLLTLVGTDRGDVATVWEHIRAPRVTNIATYSDLRLFRLLEPSRSIDGQLGPWMIEFASAHPTDGYEPSTVLLNDYRGKTVRVTLVATDCNLPKPFQKKIDDIINEAVDKVAE